MLIQLKGTNFELTPAIHAMVEEKIGPLARFVKRFEKEGEVTAFIEVARTTKHHQKGLVFYAEATLRLPGRTLRMEEYDADLRAAVDGLRDRLKRDLEKYKERATERRTRERH